MRKSRNEDRAGTKASLPQTTAPVAPGNVSDLKPEFVRVHDLQRLVGLKRGTAYNLIADRKIRSVLLRVRGSKSGVRLVHYESVLRYIEREMAKGEREGLN